jgi:hypothetical protein
VDHIQCFGSTNKREQTVVVPILAPDKGSPVDGGQGVDKQVVGVALGQVIPHHFEVVGDVFGTFKDLVIDLLQNIFDGPVMAPEYPGGIDQPGPESDTVPFQRM